MLTKDTDLATKGSLSILLFKYSGRFCLPLGNVERINAFLSICHLWAAKVRVSYTTIHLNAPKTLVKLVIVSFSRGKRGPMNSIDVIHFINYHTAQGRQRCKERKGERKKKDIPLFIPSWSAKIKRFQDGSICSSVLLQLSAKLM